MTPVPSVAALARPTAVYPVGSGTLVTAACSGDGRPSQQTGATPRRRRGGWQRLDFESCSRVGSVTVGPSLRESFVEDRLWKVTAMRAYADGDSQLH